MIRMLLVDDHPALRTGLTAVLRAEPGLVPLGTAADEEELWPALNRTKPDVVLLDYHLPPADGLVLCRRIKRTMPPPQVLLYSAYADASLVIPAVLAGADGVVNKGAPARALRRDPHGRPRRAGHAADHPRAARRRPEPPRRRGHPGPDDGPRRHQRREIAKTIGVPQERWPTGWTG
jgi:CheY-like chemotaxis protein